MQFTLTPHRRRGVEFLDDPGTDPETVRRSLCDVARANALFGGKRAAVRSLAEILPEGREELSLLDVGSGLGDIPVALTLEARRRGVRLNALALDSSETLARECLKRGAAASVRGDALNLPFADQSVDIVFCSQLLHHFTDGDAVRLLAEMNRVARLHVIVSDLRRSWLAAGGIWVASFPLGFHPISRHDGVVSVLRGFTPNELASLVHEATGRRARVRRHAGFRVTACWSTATG
jgi:SAM-dependent methyltransferase